MRDVLVFVRDCDSWRSHVSYAAALARTLQGSLTGIYVSPLSVPMSSVTSPQLSAEIIELHRREFEHAERAETPFRRWAASHGVERCAWRTADAPAAEALTAAANWTDVLVMAGSSAHDDSIGDIGELLLRVPLPCIVVPGTVDAAQLDTIAVAWNGSPESIRAMHAALPLLHYADRIVALCGRRVEPIGAALSPSKVAIDDYLAWQGLRAERIEIESGSEDAGAEILAHCASLGANLLVSGAYGRTRFSEWLLGGVTRHLLENVPLPLLLRH